MYDSINFGFVTSREIVFGGIKSRFGISNSLLMSRKYEYMASSKSGCAMTSTISSGRFQVRFGSLTKADNRDGKDTSGPLARQPLVYPCATANAVSAGSASVGVRRPVCGRRPDGGQWSGVNR